MSTVQQTIEVSAPLHAVYEQLAHLENYPQFMTGVEEVVQVSGDRTHWIMDVDGDHVEFDAQLIECSVDERVSWRSTDGPALAETITLRPIGETRTQVVAQLEADAAALMPSDRHAQESLNRRLKADLTSFKAMIEGNGGATRTASGSAMTGMRGAADLSAGARTGTSLGTAPGLGITSGAAMTGTNASGAGTAPGWGAATADGRTAAAGGLSAAAADPRVVAERIARSREAAQNGMPQEDERGSMDY